MTISMVTRKSAKFKVRKPAKSAGIAASSLLLSGLLMAYGAGMAGAADVTVNYQNDWHAAPAGSNLNLQAAGTTLINILGSSLPGIYSHSFFQTAPLTVGNIGFAAVSGNFAATTLNINGVLNTGDVTVNNGGTIEVLAGAPLSVAEDAPLVGAGTLNIGSATVAKNLVLGGTTAGTLDSAGTLNVFGTTTLNGAAAGTGDGVLNIKAGTATFTGATNVGTIATANGNNAINISGGETTFTGDLALGKTGGGKGELIMTGGIATAGNITVDGSAGKLLVGNATNGGIFTVNGLLKTTNNGSVVVDGNSASNTATLILADSATLNGGAILGGTGSTGEIKILSHGTLQVEGTKTIAWTSGTNTGLSLGIGVIAMDGGSLNAENSALNITNGAATIDFDGTVGNSVLKASSITVKTLSSAGNLTIGNTTTTNSTTVKITSTASGYLNGGATLTLEDSGILDVGNHAIQTIASSDVQLVDAKGSGSHLTVTNGTNGFTSKLIGGAITLQDNFTLGDTAKNKLGTLQGSKITASNKNLAIDNGSTLSLTDEGLTAGSTINIGTGTITVTKGTLSLAGDRTIGALDNNSSDTTVASISGVTSGAIKFTEANGNLIVGGTLTTNGTDVLKLSNNAAANTFAGNLTAGALKVGTAGNQALTFETGALTLTLTGLAITEGAAAPKFLETTGDVAVANGTLILGKNGQDLTVGGTFANNITVTNPGALTLLGGKFDILGDTTKKAGITTSGSAAVKIGDGTKAMAGHGELTGGLTHNSTGDITVNLGDNTSSYAIDNLTLSNTGDLVMTQGALNVTNLDLSNTGIITIAANTTLNATNLSLGTTHASASTWSGAGVLNVGTLTMGNAGDKFTINYNGTMKIGAFAGTNDPSAEIKIDSTNGAGTLDLSGLNITDLHKLTSGTAGSVQGFAGKVVVGNHANTTLKTTGKVSYAHDTVLTLNSGAATSAGNLGAVLYAGVLDAKKADGTTAQDVTLTTDLTLYGDGTNFLNAGKVTVNHAAANLYLGTVFDSLVAFNALTPEQRVAEIAKAKGGTSSASIDLVGGELRVGSGMYKFTNTAAVPATIAVGTGSGQIKVVQNGGLYADKIDFGTNAQNLEVKIGSDLASGNFPSTSGTLAVTSFANFGTGDELIINRGLFNYGSLTPDWLDSIISREHISKGFATLGVNNTGLDLRGGDWSIGSEKKNTLGANSLTVISAQDYALDKPAITVSSANIETGARLLLDTTGLKGSHSLTVLKSDAALEGDWAKVNSSSRLYDVSLLKSADKKNYEANISFADLSETLPGISGGMASFIQGLPLDLLTPDSTNYGLRFMARALDRGTYMNADDDHLAAITIEGAAQMSAVGGVPSTSVNTVGAISGGMSARTSIMSPTANISAVALNDQGLSLDSSGMNAGSNIPGFGLWAMPLYQNTSARGLKAGNFKTGFDSQLYGMTIGADYTLPNNLRLGATFNVGAGKAESVGSFNKTKNDFDFVGIGLYAGWTMNNFGLSADLAYTWSSNDTTQNLPSSMDMPQLKSDVDSSAFTVGLRGEYKFTVGDNAIMPHLGLRYTKLLTDSYSVKSAGNTVFHSSSDHLNVFSIPVGVAFSKNFTTNNNWLVKPQLDLGATFNVGDVDAISHMRIPGVNSTANMKSRVMDRATFDASLGISTEKEGVSLGLMYDFRVGSHTTSHGVNALLRYSF